MNVRLSALILCTLAATASFAGQTQYDSGDPTAAEQLVLEIINRARANPTAEGTRLNIDINEGLAAGKSAAPQPPLAMNKILLGTARAHSQDMYTRKFFAHNNPDGKDPFMRMDAAGYANFTSEGENIAAGSNHTSANLEDILMIDKNYPDRGHRVNLLSIGIPLYREIGVGYFSGAAVEPVAIPGNPPQQTQAKDFITQDFGANDVGPFVMGVVYKDTNNNGFYDIGEGLSGVNVAPDTGSFFAVTGTAGGFAFPVGTAGTLTITASGGALAAPVNKMVTLAGKNAKVDFIVAGGGGGGGGGTLPHITSPLSATGTVGTNFSYTITATGTAPITFDADGLAALGLTLSGATISGSPTQSGQFMLKLTATNAAGPDVQTLVLTIAPAGGGGGGGGGGPSKSLTDTDGDGFPDEIETSFGGSSPTNNASTPFNAPAGPPLPLTVKKLQLKLNFAKAASDNLSLSGSLPVPAGFAPKGRIVILDVGGVLRSFTLDEKGAAGGHGGDSFKLTLKLVKKAVLQQISTFSAKLVKASMASTLTDEGLSNANNKNIPVSIPVFILFNQQLFSATPPQTYSSKTGKTASTK